MDGVTGTLFNAAPNVQQVMAQTIAATLNDFSKTQKKIIKY